MVYTLNCIFVNYLKTVVGLHNGDKGEVVNFFTTINNSQNLVIFLKLLLCSMPHSVYTLVILLGG